jgi:LPXTG-site transpeptidase (sortase) family protein
MRNLGTWLFLIGCLLLASVVPQVVDWRREQGAARAVLRARRASVPTARLPADPAEPARAVSLARGDVIARIAVPTVGVDIIALEGIDPATLELGAGHFPTTALPGEPGNSSFAGHRDVEFRGLARIQPGQDVYVDSGIATFVYRVTDVRIVAPEDVYVLADRGGTELTLVTCYPFDWVGPAPNRFVVRAEFRGRFESRDGILAAALAGSGARRTGSDLDRSGERTPAAEPVPSSGG